MKAALYGGPGDLLVQDVAEPVLRADGMILRIRACTICGTDLKLYTVGNPRCTPPRIIGHELVGEVIAIGDEVDGFELGDRLTFATSVACNRCAYCARGLENLCPHMKCISMDYDGAFAEYMAVPADAIRGGNALRVPDGLADQAAALAEPLSCVVNAAKIAGVKPGDTVVVVGAGPMGCLCAEVAKAYGAHRVVVTQRSQERLALARRLAGVEALDVAGGDAAAQIRALTGGEGADVVFAAAPSAAAQAEAFRMVRKGGALNLFASLPRGESTIEIDTRVIHYGQIAVTGASDSRPCDVRDALDLLAAGKIDVGTLVTHELPLDRLLDGIELMRRRSGLKIAIMP
ncbi:MAG TPA: alcohol dehydrogenase catalytic domain-containing protein [Candidatus Hydrogenedentes bacterium]|nr:alcohol dehydrogenase catalytic domain-containing protein [Candidatus Hydrogenedentota bacterium]HPG67960.1 alcohol dehydrogenase catalytic domain-containing protein [Candidatus Hydrogenedentota bacterium]